MVIATGRKTCLQLVLFGCTAAGAALSYAGFAAYVAAVSAGATAVASWMAYEVLGERLKRRKGSCVIYVGGMVELFHSTPKRETVFLKKRKGFVKIALRTGADLIPIYSFGNTTVLEAFKSGPLASLSRKVGVSVTVFWGRWFLPIPKRVKLVYARGRPLGLPHIEHPTDADVVATGCPAQGGHSR